MRCPACDMPNHGMEKCVPLYDEDGRIIKTIKEEPKPVRQRDDRKFIGSGEDVVLEDVPF
jgi:hypothetical protein